MSRNPIRPPGDDLAVRFAELNRRLRALETAAPGGFTGDGTTTFLRGNRDLRVVGGNIIVDGGVVQLLDNGTPVAQLDAGGVANSFDAESRQFIGTEHEIDSGSFETTIDVSFTVPAVWAGYAVSAFWTGTYSDNADVSASMETRLRLGGSAGDTITFGRPAPVERRYPIAVVEAWPSQTTTGSRTVLVESRLVGAGGSAVIGVQNQKLVVSVKRTA